MRLQNKVAIVTGGARGIGKAISQLFAKEGASVIIWDLLEEGKATAEAIVKQGGIAEFQKISVTDKIAIEKAMKGIAEKYGKIDILINNAGITKDRSLAKMTEEEFDAVVNINLKGVFLCTQAVASYMKANKYGRIVSAASVSGLNGNFGQTNYAATKAGVVAMGKTWTLELAPFGITVNSVAPGFTMTDMTASMPAEAIERSKSQIPTRTIAEPIDIAYGYLYLASDEARFVSGICLTIDGGVTR